MKLLASHETGKSCNELGKEFNIPKAVEKVSKREAEKALKTLHKYFELSSVGDKAKFEVIFYRKIIDRK